VYEQLHSLIDKVIAQGVAKALAEEVGAVEVLHVGMVPAANLGDTHAHLLRGESEASADEGSSVLAFDVVSHDPDVTYEQLQAQIEEAARSGALSENIHNYAVQYGATSLILATMSEPTVTRTEITADEMSNADSTDDAQSPHHHVLTIWQIATVAMSVALVGVLIGVVLFGECCSVRGAERDRLRSEFANNTNGR
jgi:translation elongation factor EF-1beta